MALPAEFKNPLDYFRTSIEFLKKYACIYQHSNTAFLKSKVLEQLPIEFNDFFLNISNKELNEFPLLHIKAENAKENKKLQEFRTNLRSLIPNEAFKALSIRDIKVKYKSKFKKIKMKKQHEISRLAEVISQLCVQDKIIIDFGAGLGYLSEMLCTLNENKFLILGLESELERVYAAEKRLAEYNPDASKCIVYKKQFITEDSLPFIEASVEELSKIHNVKQRSIAIVGLHACADLTITAMKLFFDMGVKLKSLIIMPCCYHKLEMNSSSGKFRNFPLSKCLKEALVGESSYSDFLNRPFLRLACQQTLARWLNTSAEEHRLHGTDMFRRGIAEAIIDERTECIVKIKKGSQIGEKENFSFTALTQSYELKSKDSGESLDWTSQHAKRFEEISVKYNEGYKLAEGLTCLQTAMQKLCENIVLYDRLCYMQEYASEHNLKVNARYEKLLDEKLSPRCYVLIAEKL